MDGIAYLHNLAGLALSAANQRIAELEAELAGLRDRVEHANRPSGDQYLIVRGYEDEFMVSLGYDGRVTYGPGFDPKACHEILFPRALVGMERTITPATPAANAQRQPGETTTRGGGDPRDRLG